MYAHVRTYTRTRRNFSDNKSALQHYQTELNHQSDIIHLCYPTTVQSISILAPHWLRHLYKLPSFVTHLQQSSNYPPIIQSSLAHLPFIITAVHHRTHIIFYLYLMSSPTHHLINMSVCYKTLSILYILAASSTTVSHLIQITIFTNPTIIIFIMETVFRANHQQFPLCIIIHLLIFVMKFV